MITYTAGWIKLFAINSIPDTGYFTVPYFYVPELPDFLFLLEHDEISDAALAQLAKDIRANDNQLHMRFFIGMRSAVLIPPDFKRTGKLLFPVVISKLDFVWFNNTGRNLKVNVTEVFMERDISLFSTINPRNK